MGLQLKALVSFGSGEDGNIEVLAGWFFFRKINYSLGSIFIQQWHC